MPSSRPGFNSRLMHFWSNNKAMSQLINLDIASVEDLLTPVHSIPSFINFSNVSGSKGRFTEMSLEKPPIQKSSISKIPSISSSRPQHLVQSQSKLSRFSQALQETQKKSGMLDRSLTTSEKQELFGRIDREASKRSGSESNQAKPGKRTSSLNQEDVVTRLLKYGENSKKKTQEKIRKKQQDEEEEIKRLQNSRKFSEANRSPISPNTSSFSSYIDTSPQLSSNTPQKVISKIQRLVKSPSFNL